MNRVRVGKEELAHELRTELGMTLKDAKAVVQCMMESIQSFLINGEDVFLSGVGTLHVKRLKPKTILGEKYGDRVTVKLIPSKKLRKHLFDLFSSGELELE